MDNIKLASCVDVKVMPRLEVLYYFVYELAESFGVEEHVLDTIKKGILDNQILHKIFIRYKNEQGVIVGRIIIEIDWDKHFCMAKTETGKNFEIDLSKSVVDNFVGWRKYIVKHTEEIRRQFNVVKIDADYKYRTEIENDSVLFEKSLQILNHTTGIRNKEEIDEKLESRLSDVFETGKIFKSDKVDYESMNKIELMCEELEEIKLTIYSDRKND